MLLSELDSALAMEHPQLPPTPARVVSASPALLHGGGSRELRAQSVWSSVLAPAEFFFTDSMPLSALALVW